MYKVNCDLCESDSYKILGKVKENFLVKCMLCGHVYMLYRLTNEELLNIYDDDYFKDKYVKGNEKVDYDYLKDKPNIMKFVEKRFNTIHKYKKAGTILDIGCAMGFYLEYAQNCGWDVYGIEASEYAADYAKKLLKTEDIFNNTIENIKFKDEQFDVITMWLVLEHMVNPVNTLLGMKKWLKPGGVIGIKVPNADGITFRSNLSKWIQQHPEDHMCDFTPDTLERIMNKCGYELLELETEGIYIDRILKDEKYLKDQNIKEAYRDIAQKSNLGDSMVAFFKLKQ
ncbi:UNVERIFIED_ORG: methyltransferase [Clostridium botulinum]|uniref:class I SAM-dependent methyltransferase n=1 Tax=Clostridium botulinum TaxID=1491 RepID=UPI0007731579|nr:class I SAM-dependent methyltransferase [Clostridium botulinum]